MSDGALLDSKLRAFHDFPRDGSWREKDAEFAYVIPSAHACLPPDLSFFFFRTAHSLLHEIFQRSVIRSCVMTTTVY